MSESFEPIEWSDELSTGIADLDKQHRFLIEANIKLLHDNDRKHLQQVVNDMLCFALTHFDTEEKLMQRFGYENACPEESREHIAQHRNFSRHVVEVVDQLREGKKIPHLEIIKFIDHWFHDHVQVNDQLLAKFIQSKC